MANQIDRFFLHRPEPEAVADIADHLRKFWEPRMRKNICDHVDSGGDGLQPRVLKAIKRLQAETSAAGPYHPDRMSQPG